jgi:hypothetical protein
MPPWFHGPHICPSPLQVARQSGSAATSDSDRRGGAGPSPCVGDLIKGHSWCNGSYERLCAVSWRCWKRKEGSAGAISPCTNHSVALQHGNLLVQFRRLRVHSSVGSARHWTRPLRASVGAQCWNNSCPSSQAAGSATRKTLVGDSSLRATKNP